MRFCFREEGFSGWARTVKELSGDFHFLAGFPIKEEH